MEIEQKSLGLPWVEKYRPQYLRDIISHEDILNTIHTFMACNNLPNLLFYGPPGTGKTSSINAIAKQFYGKDFSDMTLELNASDERGINRVRDEIKNFAGTGNLSKNRNLKLVILDQVDMMTNTAQFALRRSTHRTRVVIEIYHSNARFCLISNYVSKIIPALQSRCTRFKFKGIPQAAAIDKITTICKMENLDISKDGIQAVLAMCQGDMRRVINMLQSLSMIGQQQITTNDVYQLTGNPSPQFLATLLNSLLNQSLSDSISYMTVELKERGMALESIIRPFYEILLQRGMPAAQKIFLIKRIGEIEFRLSIGCQQGTSIASLAGAFTQIRHID